MVLRLRVACWRDAGSCRLEAKERAEKGGSDLFWAISLKFRLRRPREPFGAPGEPQGGPWEASEYSDGLDGSDGWVPDKERG